MKKKVLLVLVFVIGIAVGQTNKSVGLYGCSSKILARSTNEDDNIPARLTVCLGYDPYMDKHFIVSTVTSVDGAGTSMIEER